MTPMQSYDVVIIGAGPAGLQCAETLGSSGMSVLLIEKHDRIGPKVCGGGLTALNTILSPPRELTRSFDQQHIILNGRTRIVSLARPIMTIDRVDLGRYQLGRVQACANVSVVTGTTVAAVEKDHLVLGDGSVVHFRHLVGADGSLSLVRRYLRLGNRLYMGMQYSIPGNYDRMVWSFEPALIRTGYAWIMPHRSFASAGVFYDPAQVPAKDAREALHRLLAQARMEQKDAALEAAPVNCLYCGTEFGNISLAGDAAGLASAMTGEGIAYAAVSGEFAARRIMDPGFVSERFEAVLRHKRTQERILSWLDSVRGLQSPLFRLLFLLAKSPRIQKHLTG